MKSLRTSPAWPPLKEGKQAPTTAKQWQQIHKLLDQNTGLLECPRRLGLSLNTVRRYAGPPGRADDPRADPGRLCQTGLLEKQ